MTAEITENYDTCEVCGNRFDFPEQDLTAEEINGIELLKCWACIDEPKLNKPNVKDL